MGLLSYYFDNYLFVLSVLKTTAGHFCFYHLNPTFVNEKYFFVDLTFWEVFRRINT